MKKFVILFSLLYNLLVAQTAYDFLRLDYSARSAALGSSFVTNTDDPSVLFYNPASVIYVNDKLISFGYLKHILDVNSGSITSAPVIPGVGKVGFGLQYINYGSFDQKDEFGNLLGTFSSNQIAATFNYSRKIYEDFAYGGNFKLIYSNIGEFSSAALAIDLGLSYFDSAKQFGLGLALLNIGTQIKKYNNSSEKVPFEIRAGISKKLEHLPARFSLDFLRLNNTDDGILNSLKSFAVGVELTLSRIIVVRLGYNNQRKQDLKLGSSSGLLGFNGGIGITVDKYKLDYGISLLGKIGEMHRVNISISY